MIGTRPPVPRKPSLPEPQYRGLSRKQLSAARRRFIFNDETVFEPVARKDIIGIDHVLAEVDGYVEFLRRFREVDKLGAELDSGVLFNGTVGTGKTLCARYLATQSGARFIDMQKFPKTEAQLSADDIGELYRLAKGYVRRRKRPIILFWDEFDSFGALPEGSPPEKIEAIGRLKTEMSGITGKARGVFLVATTNQPLSIHPPLLRPGRIGYQIPFESPNQEAKRALLEHYVLQYRHGRNIDFRNLSFLLRPNTIPSAIEEMVKKAWRYECMRAVLKNGRKPMLTRKNLIHVLLRELRGAPSSIELSGDAVRGISIYEIGRALVARTLGQPTQFIALTRFGYVGSHRITEFPKEPFVTFDELRRRIAVHCGGAVAQKLCGIGPNTGWAEDYDAATRLAFEVVERYGNGESGVSLTTLAYERDSKKLPSVMGIHSNKPYDLVEALEKLLETGRRQAEDILNFYGRERLEGFAAFFIKQEYLLETDIDRLLDPEYKLEEQERRVNIIKDIGFSRSKNGS